MRNKQTKQGYYGLNMLLQVEGKPCQYCITILRGHSKHLM